MKIKDLELLEEELVNVIKGETKPAIGCTEPVAVALAVATGRKYFQKHIESVKVQVSQNIFKNGKSVTIPNTEEAGIDIAAALGLVCGDAEAGLGVFKNIKAENVVEAKNLIKENIVTATPLFGSEPVYIIVGISGEGDKVEVLLRGSHTNIEKVLRNGVSVFEKESKDNNTTLKLDPDFFKKMDFKTLREISENIAIEKLDFILEGIEMNKKAAEEGLKKNKGLRWGASLLKLQEQGKLAKDTITRARILTAAGSDLRMGGGICPIMTSGGSGNQGLCVILPISVVAEDSEISTEKLQRAVFLGHAVNNFVKKYTGKLSAMCGCSIAAGIGAAAAITWMLGGTDEQIQGSAQNLLANLTGMVCDGAKESCAMKLSTSAAEGIMSAYLALEDVIVTTNTGIVAEDIEHTIDNVGRLCKDGLSKAEDVMLDIVLNN